MMFTTGECHQKDVYYRGVLSERCLLPESVIRMMFTIGECCHQKDVYYRGVSSERSLLPGSVITYFVHCHCVWC